MGGGWDLKSIGSLSGPELGVWKQVLLYIMKMKQ